MTKSIYVGNLPFSTTKEEVTQLFEKYGTVNAVRFINDKETGRFRGFAFIDMEEENANQAIASLNGSEFNGKTLNISEAKEKKDNNRFGGNYNKPRNTFSKRRY